MSTNLSVPRDPRSPGRHHGEREGCPQGWTAGSSLLSCKTHLQVTTFYNCPTGPTSVTTHNGGAPVSSQATAGRDGHQVCPCELPVRGGVHGAGPGWLLGHWAGFHIVLLTNDKGLKLMFGKPSNPQKQIFPQTQNERGQVEARVTAACLATIPRPCFTQIYELV